MSSTKGNMNPSRPGVSIPEPEAKVEKTPSESGPRVGPKGEYKPASYRVKSGTRTDN